MLYADLGQASSPRVKIEVYNCLNGQFYSGPLAWTGHLVLETWRSIRGQFLLCSGTMMFSPDLTKTWLWSTKLELWGAEMWICIQDKIHLFFLNYRKINKKKTFSKRYHSHLLQRLVSAHNLQKNCYFIIFHLLIKKYHNFENENTHNIWSSFVICAWK